MQTEASNTQCVVNSMIIFFRLIDQHPIFFAFALFTFFLLFQGKFLKPKLFLPFNNKCL